MLSAKRIIRLRAGSRGCSKLPFPAAPHLRAAQLSANPIFAGVECFPAGRWPELEQFRPQVLAGSTQELQKLAQCAQSRALDLSSIDHAIFAITVCGEEALSDRTRVVLWQAFGVPVYELLLSAHGTLLGSECEAHDGWHVEPNVRFAIIDGELAYLASGRTSEPTGFTGRLENGRCACGRQGVRIFDVKPVIAQATRKLAAIA